MTGSTARQENEAEMSEPSSSKKAAGAFRTISEVADELDVQQHVLRFWETKFSQIKPLKRGGGRRYYRPEDLALLKKIHTLLYTEGYTIKGVQKLLKTQGKAQLIAGTPDAVAATTRVTTTPATAAEGTSSAPASMVVTTRVSAPDLSDKQKSILQAMLGDLRDLRNMISPEK